MGEAVGLDEGMRVIGAAEGASVPGLAPVDTNMVQLGSYTRVQTGQQ